MKQKLKPKAEITAVDMVWEGFFRAHYTVQHRRGMTGGYELQSIYCVPVAHDELSAYIAAQKWLEDQGYEL